MKKKQTKKRQTKKRFMTSLLLCIATIGVVNIFAPYIYAEDLEVIETETMKLSMEEMNDHFDKINHTGKYKEVEKTVNTVEKAQEEVRAIGKKVEDSKKEVETIMTDNGIKIEVEEPAEITYKTVKDYTGDDENLKKKIAATDKWNETIYKVAEEEGVDPVYVKCIIAQESVGVLTATNDNGNGTTDYGLMQVNSSWGNIYDYSKMLKDGEYAIRCGIKVLKNKQKICESFDMETTLFNISWFYNGYNNQGKNYAKLLADLYEDMTGNSADEVYFDI